jgi:flagellar protein FliL
MDASPTVLAGTPPIAPAPAPAKFPVVSLLIAVVLGVVIATLAIGGLVYYMARSGRLPLQHTAAAKAEPVAPLPTHMMTLEPMLVNLADAGGSAYLRISMTLRVVDATKGVKTKEDENAAGGKGGDAAVAAVRDTALTVLGRQSADGLLAVDGKERLKTELKTAFAANNRDLKVADVFFTDFLVQR